MTARGSALHTVGLISALVLTLLVSAACVDDDDSRTAVAKVGDIEITDAFAHGTLGDGAVYFIMKNTGDTDDALIAASTDAAAEATLHKTVAGEGATMKMQPVEQIGISAGGQITLGPGGFHVMLTDLKEPLAIGGTIEVRLTFQRAGTVSIEAAVTSFAQPDDEMEGGMGG